MHIDIEELIGRNWFGNSLSFRIRSSGAVACSIDSIPPTDGRGAFQLPTLEFSETGKNRRNEED